VRDDAENILGYPIATASAADCVARVMTWLGGERRGRYFACANPHSLEVARRDARFARAIRQADFIVPDGVGMVIASRLLGGRIRQRVTGSDIFAGLCAAMSRKGGYSTFLLGASEDTLLRMKAKMAQEFPGLRVAGLYAPPFKAEFSAADNQAMVAAVNRVHPDVLWVGMTAPKQEKWTHRHRHRLAARFIGPVGAVFDYYPGNVRRPSPLFQSLGLEWLPRLLQEPRRLWRRNLISNPRFLLRIIRDSALYNLDFSLRSK